MNFSPTAVTDPWSIKFPNLPTSGGSGNPALVTEQLLIFRVSGVDGQATLPGRITFKISYTFFGYGLNPSKNYSGDIPGPLAIRPSTWPFDD